MISELLTRTYKIGPKHTNIIKEEITNNDNNGTKNRKIN